jgi:hypothetical protein
VIVDGNDCAPVRGIDDALVRCVARSLTLISWGRVRRIRGRRRGRAAHPLRGQRQAQVAVGSLFWVTNWNQMAAEAAWVIAIIALMAFIVAAIALAVALNIYSAQQQTLELQRKQSEEQRREARREQAAKVSFFVDVNNDRQFQLKVINTSDYPILELRPSCSHAPKCSRSCVGPKPATDRGYSVHNDVAPERASAQL